MISHEACREALGEFLDQTLDENRRVEVASHLEFCAECAANARELAAIRSTLREIEPAPAPPQLRRNVRAALEAEREARQREARRGSRLSRRNWPPFAMPQLKMSPLTWSGTLALAAFTLMVLARPFANAPEMVAETSPEIASPPRLPPSAPDLKTAPKSDPSPTQSIPALSNQARQPSNPQPRFAPRSAPKTRATNPKTPASPRQNRDLNSIRKPASPLTQPSLPAEALSNDTTKPAPQSLMPAPRTAARARNQEKPQNSTAAPEVRSAEKLRTSVPPPAPIAPRSKLADADTEPRSRSTNPTGAATSGALDGASNGAARPNLRAASPAPQAKVFAPQKSGATPQNPNSNVLRSAGSAPLTPSAPFVFSLRSRPGNAAGFARADVMRARVAAPEPALPQRGAADEAAKTEPTRENETAGARAATPGSAFKAPENRALQAPRANGADSLTAVRDNALPPDARDFELQIQSPRRVSNAQIRLETPPELRLFSEVAGVIWSGDLALKTPLQISFSLAGTTGGEKISVVLEQKIGGAPSRILQKQILVVPPAP